MRIHPVNFLLLSVNTLYLHPASVSSQNGKSWLPCTTHAVGRESNLYIVVVWNPDGIILVDIRAKHNDCSDNITISQNILSAQHEKVPYQIKFPINPCDGLCETCFNPCPD